MGYLTPRRGRRAVVRHAAVFLSSIALAILGPIAIHPASAQSAKVEAKPQTAPQGTTAQQRRPLVAVISTGRQRITVYDSTGPVMQAPISSGRKGFESPEGVFSILEKKQDHFSNVYEDGEMPFMQRLTWSGVALHAGNLPGYPASHGCIRMPHQFAERLFDVTRINTRVVVLPNDAVPMPISHPRLFRANLSQSIERPDSTPEAAQSTPARLVPLFQQHDSSDQPMMLGARVMKPPAPEGSEPTLKPQKAVVTPLEAARAQRTAALAKVVASTKAADAAKLLHKTKLAEAAKLQRSANAASTLEKRAWGRITAAEKQVTNARTEQQLERARDEHNKLLEQASLNTRELSELKVQIALRTQEAREAEETAKRAEQAKIEAQNDARTADRLTDPISILVSRKTGRLYIRQGRHPMGDMTVAIKDPQQPIGTHVFTVMDVDRAGTPSWLAVTAQPPAGSELPVPAVPQSSIRGKRSKAEPPAPPVSRSSVALGAAALDRIVFSGEALARISPYIQAGSSLIISDHAPSIEMAAGTDFIIQTRGEDRAIADAEQRAREAAAFRAGEKWARDLMAERAEKAERAKERALARAEERGLERGERPKPRRVYY